MTLLRSAAFALGLFALSTGANAAAVDVSYTAAQSASGWTYDFTLTNNILSGSRIYSFGVDLDGTPVSETQPSSWSPVSGPPTPVTGGSGQTYDYGWINPVSPLNYGQSAEFVVTVSGAPQQTSVPWFALAFGADPADDGHFGSDPFPKFEGTANLPVAAVPEASTWAMMLLGFAALGSLAYRRRQFA